ncbi:hypothetical protein J6590_064306 [Homalodisca vitripennis]|nr:hypothetical protein J6590_064306 [Homalodisca vitripennis]
MQEAWPRRDEERKEIKKELLRFSEADIKDLGVKNSSHRARMVSSLVALRAKYEKDLGAMRGRRGITPTPLLCPPNCRFVYCRLVVRFNRPDLRFMIMPASAGLLPAR